MKTTTKQSSWIRGFLAILFFQLGLALPLHTQASIHDILVTVGKLGPVLNTYIKPLQLEWLAPLEQAITTCSFGSDIEITQCADKILSSDAAKDLGGAQAGQIKSMLEIYLDVREGDIAELFNDVVKLAAGQSPLDLACSVVTIIAGGFPVCDLLKALYEVAKLAYEAAKAIVGALADIGCAFYSLLGGSCGSSGRKVAMDEFAAQPFLTAPGLPTSLPIRLSNKANWDKHKAEVLAAYPKSMINLFGDHREIGWNWYINNIVYPEWDKIVYAQMMPSIATVYSNLNIEAQRATLLADSAATQQSKLSALLSTCTLNEKILGDKVDEWNRERKKSNVTVIGNCPYEISFYLLKNNNYDDKDDICQSTDNAPKSVPTANGMTQNVRSKRYTCDSLDKKMLCTSAQKVLGADVITDCAITDKLKGVDNRDQAQVAIMEYIKGDPFGKAGVKCSFNLLQSTTSIGCEDPTYTQKCNGMLQSQFGAKLGIPKAGIMDCQTRVSSQEKKWAALTPQLAEVLTPGYVFNLNLNNPTPASTIKYRSCKVDGNDPLIVHCPGDPIATTHPNFKLAEQLMGAGNANECSAADVKRSPHWVDKPCVTWDRKSAVIAVVGGNIGANIGGAGTTVAGLGNLGSKIPPAVVLPPPLPAPPAPVFVPPPLPTPPAPKPPAAVLKPPLQAMIPVPVQPTISTLKPPIGTLVRPADKPIAIEGCSLFLGRTTELLCNSDKGFNECKPFVDSGKLQSCRRTGVVQAYQKR